MSYLTNSDQSIKLIMPTKPQQKFTIGRTPQNTLQILDSTVSKNHALIYYFAHQKKYVLEDLGSINGTYVNGSIVSGTKTYLKHNDEIQFGKNEDKYYMRFTHPEPEKKGKISFKDYHFELEDSLNAQPVIHPKRVPEPPSTVNVQSKTQVGWNKLSKVSQEGGDKRNRQKFQRAIKIPKFEQFLQMQGSELSQENHKQPAQNQTQGQVSAKKWAKTKQQSSKKGTVKLPELNRVQLSQQDKLNKMIMQRKRELQKAQRQGLLKKAQQEQRMIEERLRLELQRAEQEEQIQREKYEMQKRAQEQQKNIQREKALIQQKLRLQQQQVRQRQQLRRLQLKQKQQCLLNELSKVKQYQMLKLKQKQHQILIHLQEQKDKQILQLKQTQQKKRLLKQQQIKKQVQSRKRELQLQAEALARQYENIYKETIRKLKLNIEAQQQRAAELQSEIEKLDKENEDLASCITVEQEEQTILRQQFTDITSRNKSFLLYASHLQSKIDTLKLSLQQSTIPNPSKTTLQLKQSLIHSRKLLNMKLNQHHQLQTQSKQIFMKLSVSSPQSQQYLGIIIEHYQEIQKLKELYFEFLEEEKVVENKWGLELEENNLLQEKVRNLKKQIQSNKKKLSQNLNDNLKKLTQQRLHMLKMMYYVPQQKKSAAKYLIQQMLNIDSQNRAIILDSQQVHSRITQLIISIQDKKRQNQHLSEIIFGNDTLSHHFDNMKAQINRLIDCIQNERDEYKVTNLLKMSQEVKEIQNKIYLQTRREKKLKDEIKNTAYTIPPLNTQKNPLVFFGKILAKKQAELNTAEQEERMLEKKLVEMRTKVSALTDKKSKINKLLQDYKQKELKNVRDYLK